MGTPAEYKARYEKQEISVGLSFDLPISYQGANGKYLVADHVELSVKMDFRKEVFALEINGTSTEIPHLAPSRLRCYELVALLPASALAEAEEELKELAEHYKSIEQTKTTPPKNLPFPKIVTAKVDRIVRR